MRGVLGTFLGHAPCTQAADYLPARDQVRGPATTQEVALGSARFFVLKKNLPPYRLQPEPKHGNRLSNWLPPLVIALVVARSGPPPEDERLGSNTQPSAGTPL